MDKALYTHAFNYLPTPTLLLKADAPTYTIIDINDAFSKLLNKSKQDITGHSFTSISTADNEALLQQQLSALHQVMITGQTSAPIPQEGDKYAILAPVLGDNSTVEYIIYTIHPNSTVATYNTGNQDKLQTASKIITELIQTVDGIVWEAQADTFAFTFISDKVKEILGYTPEEWLSDDEFWKKHIHPDDRDEAVNFCSLQTKKALNHIFDYRMIKADGSIIWIKDVVSVITNGDKPHLLRGIMVDVTATKRMQDLEHLEKSVLELNSQKDIGIEHVLNIYMVGLENILPEMICSINRVKDNRLYNLAGSSLPEKFTTAIEGIAIGEGVGSCGTAAYIKELVIVEDIAQDVLWKDYKDIAIGSNLRACWSQPILDNTGNVMAVLGLYYNKVKSPDKEALKIIERTAAILKILLENRNNLESLETHIQTIEQKNKQLQEIAWIQSHIVRAPLARMMGLIELITHHTGTDIDKQKMLEHIVSTAHELDGIIRDISRKAGDE